MDVRLELPRDEMAFRRVYRPLLNRETLHTVFRPGVRNCGKYRGYCEGEIVKARVLESIGADWAGVAPKFDPDFTKLIRIRSNQVKRISDLRPEDFVGSSPDVHDANSLRYHLGVIYNIDSDDLGDDAEVTQIRFEYVQGK